MSSKKKYHSNAAEVIEATGGFLNSVKRPGFVISFILICGFFYIIYSLGNKFLDYETKNIEFANKNFNMSSSIKNAIIDQNNLVIKQNEILENQKKCFYLDKKR